MNSWKIISYICVALLVILILIIIESYRECHKFRVTSYNIDSGLKNDINLKILMISDLHNINHFGNRNDKLLQFARDYKPDAIVLAGDMIVSHDNENEANLKTAEFINELAGITDVYYGIGNHEKYYTNHGEPFITYWDNYISKLSNKVHRLENEKMCIDNGLNKICLYGLDLPILYYGRLKNVELKKDKLTELIGNIDKEKYNILIAHNPEYFNSYADWGANLILSGHNHGGLIKLPFLGGVLSPKLHIFPKYDYGVYKKDKSTMILSNGLGAHSIKIRVNNIPEVVCIHVS